MDGGTGRLWTFAGGRINHTLKHALELVGGWKVVADNILLRIEGAGVNHGTVDAALAKLKDRAFWANADTRKTLLARLPDFRLSKFQGALPDEMQVEMVGAYLLDFEGAQRFLAFTNQEK